MRRNRTIAAVAASVALLPAAAAAHPHVFAESRMEIVGTPDGRLASVRNIWRMDELFSSAVLFDFDKNADGQLDAEELAAVGAVVKESLAEWRYYTFVEVAGRDIPLNPPDAIRTVFQDGQLLMFFEMLPKEPLDLRAAPATFSVFDDSFFVAFDYEGEAAFDLLDFPAACTKGVHVPDPDAAAEEWMNSISMLQPDQSVPDDGVEWGKVFSTTVEVRCP